MELGSYFFFLQEQIKDIIIGTDGSPGIPRSQDFVTILAGTDTMQRHHLVVVSARTTKRHHHHGDDIAVSFTLLAHRDASPPSLHDDLLKALDTPSNFGTYMFEGSNLAVITDKLKSVQDPGDLLHLRETLLEELGPPLMWLVKPLASRIGNFDH
jgi:hypothetical protein